MQAKDTLKQQRSRNQFNDLSINNKDWRNSNNFMERENTKELRWNVHRKSNIKDIHAVMPLPRNARKTAKRRRMKNPLYFPYIL